MALQRGSFQVNEDAQGEAREWSLELQAKTRKGLVATRSVGVNGYSTIP
jgi:hypothetical protein